MKLKVSEKIATCIAAVVLNLLQITIYTVVLLSTCEHILANVCTAVSCQNMIHKHFMLPSSAPDHHYINYEC
jgi:hypothetical protein